MSPPSGWELETPPSRYDLANYGLALDGSGESAKLAAVFAKYGAGLYVVRPGSVLGLDDVNGVTLPDDTYLAVAPGAQAKWVGAAGGKMFTWRTSSPTIRSGVIGLDGAFGVIDPNAAQAAGVVFDVHSLQVGKIASLDVLDGDANTIVLQLLADAAAAGGKFGTKNTTHSYFGELLGGTCAKFLTTLGAPGRVTNLGLGNMHVHDPRVCGYDFGTNTDTLTWYGSVRARPNVNNVIGVRWAASAQCYGFDFQDLVVDTPAGGQTGRQGLVAGNGCSRIKIGKYWNNPPAEGGAIVDGGATPTPFEIDSGSWALAGANSSLQRLEQVIAPLNRVAALTFAGGGAAVATDAGRAGPDGIFTLVATDGIAFTISNPTNLSAGQRITYDVKNGTAGALGAITWGALFLPAGWVNPAAGKRKTVTFYYDGTNLVQVGPPSADL